MTEKPTSENIFTLPFMSPCQSSEPPTPRACSRVKGRATSMLKVFCHFDEWNVGPVLKFLWSDNLCTPLAERVS